MIARFILFIHNTRLGQPNQRETTIAFPCLRDLSLSTYLLLSPANYTVYSIYLPVALPVALRARVRVNYLRVQPVRYLPAVQSLESARGNRGSLGRTEPEQYSRRPERTRQRRIGRHVTQSRRRSRAQMGRKKRARPLLPSCTWRSSAARERSLHGEG